MIMLGERLPLELYYMVTAYIPSSDLLHLCQTDRLHYFTTLQLLNQHDTQGILIYAIKRNSVDYLVPRLTAEMLEFNFKDVIIAQGIVIRSVSAWYGAWDVIDLLCASGMRLGWRRKQVLLTEMWWERVHGKGFYLVKPHSYVVWRVLMFHAGSVISRSAKFVVFSH